MVMSVDVYKNNCEPFDSWDEPKEEQPETLAEGSKPEDIEDQNSVVDEEESGQEHVLPEPYKNVSLISQPSFLPLVAPDVLDEHSSGPPLQNVARQDSMENDKSIDIDRDGGDKLRELRLQRLFTCDNNTSETPEGRLACALAELEEQDSKIKRLEEALKQAKSRPHEQQQCNSLEPAREQFVSSDEKNTSDSAMKAEVVCLRSQLVNAMAQLSNVPREDAVGEIEKGESLGQLETDMQQIDSTESALRQLQVAKKQIAELSSQLTKNEKLFQNSKKRLSQELEHAKVEVTKLKTEAFDKALKLAQAESRAESLENCVKVRANELSEASGNNAVDENETPKKQTNSICLSS